MNYPLISEYIEAIKSAEDNFEELSYLRPVLGDDGLPVMTSGNFAVVFKMKDEQSGKFYAVKCFTKEQEGRAESYCEIAKELKDISSPYLVSIRYLEKEVFVDTDQTTETEFPVLLMDWVEGKTLDKYLRENLDDKYTLEMLAYRFSQLAQWLIPQPFAHGDLKPDNILVRKDGSLVLVDYDGMYVPAMKGQKARELGSPDFRHPLRTEEDFDEHIDDFSLVSILLSLKSISINPQLLNEYGAADRLLFSVSEYSSLRNSKILKTLFPSDDNEVNLLYGLFVSMIASKLMLLYDGNIFLLSVPMLSTEIPSQCNEIRDVCIRYSQDFKHVLGLYGRDNELPFVPFDLIEIDKRAMIICDDAFNIASETNKYWLSFDINGNPSVYISDIEIPSNIVAIGKRSLSNIHEPLYTIRIKLNEGLISIGDYAFAGSDVDYIEIPSSASVIGRGIFAWCRKLKHIVLPDTIDTIPSEIFSGCESLTTICLPHKLKAIESHAFEGCNSLVSLSIPDGVKSIGDYAFSGCSNLKTLSLPDSLSSIGEEAFSGCKNLVLSSLPPYCKTIGDKAFYGCIEIPNFKLPNGQWIEHYNGEENRRLLLKRLEELK